MPVYIHTCKCGTQMNLGIPDDFGDWIPAFRGIMAAVICKPCYDLAASVTQLTDDDTHRVCRDGSVPMRLATTFDKSLSWPELVSWAYQMSAAKESMLITGETGCGKTRLAARMAMAAVKNRRCRAVHWFRDTDLRRLAAHMQREGMYEYRHWREALLASGNLLVIDDVGKAVLTESAREFYWDLFDGMYSLGTAWVWMTSNLTRSDFCNLFGSKYAPPMERRLKDLVKTWPDDAQAFVRFGSTPPARRAAPQVYADYVEEVI